MPKIELIQGDCLEKMKDIPDGSVDAIVTDPPYGLEFMGKEWDKGVPGVHFWQEMIRVLKPGGYLLSFSGTRTYHRMATAIEDGGFEIRDMIEWVYGSGFPKSLNIGKAMDGKIGTQSQGFSASGDDGRKAELKQNLNFRSDYGYKFEPKSDNAKQWEGWGTALKPAHEPICMARKPLAEKTVAENVLKYGTGGINIDESRVEHNEKKIKATSSTGFNEHNTYQKGTGREYTSQGRFPANLIHDNSEEVRECFPETVGAGNKIGTPRKSGTFFTDEQTQVNMKYDNGGSTARFFKSIIYQAKASKAERNKGCEGLEEKKQIEVSSQDKTLLIPDKNNNNKLRENPYLGATSGVRTNNHPTVKPVALMEYLIKMVTPKGGIVLDPFMGSGSTGIACKNLNRNFIGIELDPEYLKIAEKRINENL